MTWATVPDQTLHVSSGSALDLSGLRKTAVPAGSNGRIQIHGSDATKFAEAGDPTTEVRMFVATWAPDQTSVPLPTDRGAIVSGVQHLARKGFNAFRLHGIEYWLMAGTTGAFSFPASMLDDLYYFMAVLKEYGLYWIITPRQNQLWQDGEGSNRFADMPVGSPDLKPRIFVQQNARDHYETGLNLLYNQVNPYTGINMMQDPALFLAESFNECSMSQTGQVTWPDVWQTRESTQGTAAYTWPEWLADSAMSHGYANIAALNASWGTAYANFAAIPTPTELPNQSLPATNVSIDMVKYCTYLDAHLIAFHADVWDRSGYTGLRSGMTTFPSLIALRNMTSDGNDVVNLHDYTFLAETLAINTPLYNGNPNNPVWEWESWMTTGGIFTSGKPAYLGEYGWPYWGQYRNQYPMLAAYARFHGVSGISLFHQGDFFDATYSDASRARTKKMYPYSGHADPVVIFSEYVCFFAYHMGYVTESTATKDLTLSDRYYGVNPKSTGRINRAFFKLFLPTAQFAGVMKTRVTYSTDTGDDTLATALATNWKTSLDALLAAGTIAATNKGYVSTTANNGTITAVETSGTVGSVTASATQPVLTIGSNTLVTGDQIAITDITGSGGTWPGTNGRGTRATIATIGVSNKVQITSGLNLTGLTGFTSGTWCEMANEVETHTKEIFYSRRRKLAGIDAQKMFYFVSAGASGIFPFSHRLGQVRLDSITDGAAMFVAALDDTRLMASNSMLIGLVGNVRNTGETWANAEHTELATLGDYPIEIESGSCTFRLTVSEGMTSGSDELTLSGDDNGSATITAIDANTIEVTVSTGSDAAVFWELRRTGGMFRFFPGR